MKLTCTIEDEVRDYIRNHDEFRYSELEISKEGFFYCKDKMSDDKILSPICDFEEISDILRWHRTEIKMRNEY